MVPKNCYVSQQDLGPFPLGIRIDYVLYKVRLLFPACLLHSPPLSLARAGLRPLMAGEWDPVGWFSGRISSFCVFLLFLGSLWVPHLL